jgi:hypothetical protein
MFVLQDRIAVIVFKRRQVESTKRRTVFGRCPPELATKLLRRGFAHPL